MESTQILMIGKMFLKRGFITINNLACVIRANEKFVLSEKKKGHS